MATITVSEQDIVAAETYLTTYLQEKITGADFSPGSVVRDFVVKAIAYIFAFFRSEIKSSRDQQSLLALQQQPPSTEVDEAVNALLSNLFIARRAGTQARVVATLHFSNRTSVIIAPTTRFFRGNLAFTLEQTSNLSIPSSSLEQVLKSDGSAEYTYQVPLICATTGTDGNIGPGRFTSVDRFNSFFTFAETLDYGTGGQGEETTEDLLARAPTALSVRNLVNVRSVEAVLLEKFPELGAVLTVGFGDAEMRRDKVTEGVTQISMHVGGHMDVFVKLPVYPMTEDGAEGYVIGADGVRADGVINVFSDPDANFLSGPAVVAGDVLKVNDGIPGAPREFIINAVEATRVFVSERAAFPVEATNLHYSIGSDQPYYTNKRYSPTGLLTGDTTNVIQKNDAVFLTGRPHGKIRKLEIENTPGVWQQLNRVNLEAVNTGEYSVSVLTPETFQSDVCVERINLPTGTNGKGLRLTFDTLSGFDSVSAAVTDAFERNVCANNMVRGYIPVYIGVIGNYAMTPGAAELDEDVFNETLSTFLQDWDTTTPLDVSSITSFLRQKFPTINRFYDPVTVFFTVFAPDGQMYEFQTTDVVMVFPDGKAKVSLRGEGAHPLRDDALLAGLRFPDNQEAYTASLAALQGIFMELGVTNRNIRYLPDVDNFSLERFVD